jgi:site-specific recombinase XerD
LKRPPEVLSVGEIEALLAGCSRRAPTGKRNRALITLMWRTGLRIGEALALSARDVDTERRVVFVQHGKGDKARRLGLDGLALAELELWLQVRPRSQWLFCTLSGHSMDQSYVRHLMRRLGLRGAVEGRCHPHALRHTFTAEIVREGVPMPVVRDMLGHTDLRVTDRYCRGVAPREVIEAMQQR